MSKFCAKYMPQVIRQMPAYNRGNWISSSVASREHGAALTQVFHKMDDMLRDEKFYTEVQRCARARSSYGRTERAECVGVARRELTARAMERRGRSPWVTRG